LYVCENYCPGTPINADTTWKIIAAVCGGVLAMTLGIAGGFVFYRKYWTKRHYYERLR